MGDLRGEMKKNLEGKIKRRTGAAGGFEGEKGGLERGVGNVELQRKKKKKNRGGREETSRSELHSSCSS